MFTAFLGSLIAGVLLSCPVEGRDIKLMNMDDSDLVDVLGRQCQFVWCIKDIGCHSSGCQGAFQTTSIISEDTQTRCFDWGYKYGCRGVVLMADFTCKLTGPCSGLPQLPPKT